MPTGNLIPQIGQILQVLIPKTATGEAAWMNDGEMLTIHLPNVLVSIGADTTGDNRTEYYAIVALPNGKEIAKVTVLPGDPYYGVFEQMYTSAQDASWATLAREIEKSVLEQDIVGTTTTVPPELPSQPSPEQAQSFFQKVKGDWELDYSHGKEMVKIDENGNYFVISLKYRQGVSSPIRSKFRLDLLACNDTLTAVEIAKVLPNGRTYQIEVLDLIADRMTGYAKHDGHKLAYSRR